MSALSLAAARRRQPQRRPRRRWVKLIPVAVVGLITLAPLYWMVITALRRDATLFSVPPKILPTDLDPSVAGRAVADTPIIGWLGNSAVVSIGATVAAMLLGLPAGYALSRFSKQTRRFGSAILLTQMLPPLLLLVPLFVVFRWLSLVDTLQGLILANTAMVLPLTIWMSKAVMDSVPIELDQQAMIDGCSRLKVMLRVVVPIIRPGLASVAIYVFIVTWDEFLFARTLLTTSPDLWPASVGIYSFQGQYITPVNQVMFAALLFTVPPLVLFLIARRGLVSGMTAGAMKG